MRTSRRLTPEQQALASDPDHIRLAGRIAAVAGRRFPPLADEFQSEAPLALCQAAATWDPGGGATFKTHAAARIQGAILDVRRHWTAQGFRRNIATAPLTGTLEHPVGDDDGEPTRLGDVIAADEEPVGWGIEYQDELESLAGRLGSRLGWVLRSLYGRCDLATMLAVGESAGVSQSWISKLHGDAIGQLAERSRGGVKVR